MSNVALCVCIKNENKYLDEFLEYYFEKIHIDFMIIFDNNDEDGEHINIPIKYRCKTKIFNVQGTKNIQHDAYSLAYQICNHLNMNWIAYFDADEFLVLNKHKDIHELVDDPMFKDCIEIKINWRVYDDNGLLYYDPRPVMERFTHPNDETSINKHVKCIVRTRQWTLDPAGRVYINCNGKELTCRHYFNNAHFSLLCNHGNIDRRLDVLGNEHPRNMAFNDNYLATYEVAYIKHFLYKTAEEYIDKVKRGRVDLKHQEIDVNHRITEFFWVNEYSKEKEDLIRNALNDFLKNRYKKK